jgi:hypothetical protein
MQEHSEAAWKIASIYSGILASETRDLAAHIDAAMKAEYVRGYEDACKWANNELAKLKTGASGAGQSPPIAS